MRVGLLVTLDVSADYVEMLARHRLSSPDVVLRQLVNLLEVAADSALRHIGGVKSVRIRAAVDSEDEQVKSIRNLKSEATQ